MIQSAQLFGHYPRRQSKLSEVKRTLERRYHVRVETVALDLSEPDAPRNLHDYTVSHGLTVDHLVNNAGFADWTGFLDADWHRQHEMMQLNMARAFRIDVGKCQISSRLRK